MAMENQATLTQGKKHTVYDEAIRKLYDKYKALYLDTLEQAHSLGNAQEVICNFLSKHVIPARGQSISDKASAVATDGKFNLPATTVSFVYDAMTQKGKITYSKDEAQIIQKKFIALSFEAFQTTMDSTCSMVNLKCSNFAFKEGKDGSYKYSFDVAFDFEE